MPRLFMSNNDVINAGHNNWLFAPGTDMDLERLRLSHMQKGTYYVQIYDQLNYYIFKRLSFFGDNYTRNINIMRFLFQNYNRNPLPQSLFYLL